MFSRYLMLGAAVFLLGACSSTDKGAVDGSGMNGDGMTGANASIVPGTQQDLVVNVGDRVFFDLDSSNLTEYARATLEKQAQWLGQYSNLNVVIEGHCDERGTREYNLALGERRANAVKTYLVSLGVSPSRVSTISYGKERPEVPGSDEGSWSQNRRGVTIVQ